MSQRSITQQFEFLGAPLVNTRWSWGASTPGAVVLRVWQDRSENRDGALYTRITHHDKYMDFDSLGWKERLQHVEEIKAGKPSYFIMCRVADPKTNPRKIAGFDDKIVFAGGQVIEFQNDLWVELIDKIPAIKAREAITALDPL